MSKIFGTRKKEDESSPSGYEVVLFTISPDGGNYKELAKLALGEDQFFEGAIAAGRGVFLNVYDQLTDRYSIMFFDMTTGEQSILDLGLSDDEKLRSIYPVYNQYRYMGDEYICFFAEDLENGGGRIIDLNTNTLQSSSQDFPFDYFISISRNLVTTSDGIYSRSDYSVPYGYASWGWVSHKIYEPDIPDGSYKHAYFNDAEAGADIGLWLSEYGLHGEESHRLVIPEQEYFSSSFREGYAVSNDLSVFHGSGTYYDWSSPDGEGTTSNLFFASDSGEILREVEGYGGEAFFSGDGRYAVIDYAYSVLDNGAIYDLLDPLLRIDPVSDWYLMGFYNGSSGEKTRPVFWTELKNTVEAY